MLSANYRRLNNLRRVFAGRRRMYQLMRGATAIGVSAQDALRLAIRCARDSMPPLRLAILDDVAVHPDTRGAKLATELATSAPAPRYPFWRPTLPQAGRSHSEPTD